MWELYNHQWICRPVAAIQQIYQNHIIWSICFCSALSQNPVWWLMEGPRTITHDFSKSCCEANIQLVIHNSSEHNTTVRVVTSDCMAEKSQTAPSHESASGQGGWYDVSLENDIKAIASTKGTHSQKQSSESISPFVWCSLSSAQVDRSSFTILSDDMLKTGSWSLYTSNFSPVLCLQKNRKIRNKSLVQLMQIITELVNNLNKMEKIIEEHALRCQRLMATSNNLQQVLDSYIEYPKDSIPPNSYKCQR